MQKLIIVEKDGRKRQAISTKCPACGIKFLTRKDQPHTCCSRKCSYKHNIKPLVVVKCAWCGKDVYRKKGGFKSSKSGLYFCNRLCKESAQKLGGIKEIMPSHYGTSDGENSYRELFEPEELICARCSYNEFIGSIQIHHKDRNRKNNIKDNLIPLCANCHMGLHHGNWKL
jgi:hypothetical protein